MSFSIPVQKMPADTRPAIVRLFYSEKVFRLGALLHRHIRLPLPHGLEGKGRKFQSLKR